MTYFLFSQDYDQFDLANEIDKLEQFVKVEEPSEEPDNVCITYYLYIIYNYINKLCKYFINKKQNTGFFKKYIYNNISTIGAIWLLKHWLIILANFILPMVY